MPLASAPGAGESWLTCGCLGRGSIYGPRLDACTHSDAYRSLAQAWRGSCRPVR